MGTMYNILFLSIEFLIVTIVLLIQIKLCTSLQNSIFITKPDPYKKWSHHILLKSNMEIKWNVEDENYITMEMSGPTTGYIGIGFSPKGKMQGADIVLGWIDSRGIPYIMDCHALGEGPPITDLQQDYELINAEERENRTTIGFRRRWDTCDDKYDMRIGNDTMRLIWAYYKDDPIRKPFLQHHYHGTNTRGVQSVYMRTHSNTARFPDDVFTGERNIKNWDIAMSNVRIDRKNSNYFCKIVKFPKPNKKHHMIGFRPSITHGNEEMVHHISVYVCRLPLNFGDPIRIFESYLRTSDQECYSHNTPSDWIQFCSTFLFTWGIGSEGEMLPSHVGIPLGGQVSGDSTYFKLEIHYDNPSTRTFIDNSGIRIFYTDNLRRFDASILFLGHRVTPFQMIPHSQENFKTYSFCSKECTQQGIIEPTGLQIISVLLHGHLAAKMIRLRHIRNNKELPPITEDNNYDFKYQQFRVLSKEVNVLPGDELIVECNYDTTGRDRMTLGGFSTQEEMCQGIVLYYPQTNLTDCRSQPEFYSFLNAFGIENVTGELITKFNFPYNRQNRQQSMDSNIFDSDSEYLPPDNSFQIIAGNAKYSENPFNFFQITSPFHRNGMSVGEYLQRMNWKDKTLVKRLENSWKNGFHYMFCGQNGQRRIFIESQMTHYPKFEKYEEVTRSQCRYGNQKSQGSLECRISSTSSYISLILFHVFFFY